MAEALSQVASQLASQVAANAAPRVASSKTLWLVVAAPLFGLAWHVVGRLRRAPRAGGAWSARIGIASVLLAATATLGQAVRLARVQGGVDALAQRTSGGVEVGRLGFGFGLVFDRLAALGCGLACAAAMGAAIVTARRPGATSSARSWLWLDLALAGGLLTFVADGLTATLLGWTLLAASAATLDGWADAGAGALRATRGAAAIVALFVGSAALAAAAASPDAALGGLGASLPPAALGAFLLAAAGLSAWSVPWQAPLALSGLASVTAGLAGPFLLFRLSPAALAVPRGAVAIGAAGAIFLVFAALRAFRAPAGAARWLGLLASAPAGLACVSLSADGVAGASFVLAVSGLVSGALLISTDAAGVALVRAAPGPAPGSTAGGLEDALLGRAPAAAGTLLIAFERSVIDPIEGLVAVLARASAWSLARADEHVLGAPVNALAARTLRASRAVEPIVGGSLARVVWALFGLGASAALLHALFWAGR